MVASTDASCVWKSGAVVRAMVGIRVVNVVDLSWFLVMSNPSLNLISSSGFYTLI